MSLFYDLEMTGQELSERLDKVLTNEDAIADVEETKADAADVYNKSEVYTKQQTNAEITAERDRAEAVEATKANAADVYTKTAADEKIAADVLVEKNRAEGVEATKANAEDVYTKTAADAKIAADVLVEKNRAEGVEGGLRTDVGNIQALIPSGATAENKLADKSFVNSSIATNTADYISNDGQPFTSLEQLEAYSGPLTNNDYAFVVSTDAAGNTIYTRYKYNATTETWAVEYVLNNSSFTSEQWAAINSGITAALTGKLSDLPTDAQLTQFLAGKQDVLTFDDVPTQGSNNPVKSGGVYTSVGNEATARAGADSNLQGQIDDIIDATSVLSLTATPNLVQVGVATNIALAAASSIAADAIILKRGDTQLATGSGTSLNATDQLTASAEGTTTYRALFTIGNAHGEKDVTVKAVLPIYYGAGQAYTDAVATTLKESPQGAYNITVANTGDYMFICIPYSMNLSRITMNGWNIPLNPYDSQVIGGHAYKIYKTANAYDAGTYTVVVE
jgi:hypothetical protein